MGESDEDWEAGIEVHLTGERAAGGGGRLAGANTFCVAASTAAGRFGGTMKCK